LRQAKLGWNADVPVTFSGLSTMRSRNSWVVRVFSVVRQNLLAPQTKEKALTSQTYVLFEFWAKCGHLRQTMHI